MVEARAVAPSKRQKLKHVASNKPAANDDSRIILTNVNVEEYKVNPEEFEELLDKRPVGAQIFIQFHNSDNAAVGE